MGLITNFKRKNLYYSCYLMMYKLIDRYNLKDVTPAKPLKESEFNDNELYIVSGIKNENTRYLFYYYSMIKDLKPVSKLLKFYEHEWITPAVRSYDLKCLTFIPPQYHTSLGSLLAVKIWDDKPGSKIIHVVSDHIGTLLLDVTKHSYICTPDKVIIYRTIQEINELYESLQLNKSTNDNYNVSILPIILELDPIAIWNDLWPDQVIYINGLYRLCKKFTVLQKQP